MRESWKSWNDSSQFPALLDEIDETSSWTNLYEKERLATIFYFRETVFQQTKPKLKKDKTRIRTSWKETKHYRVFDGHEKCL
jgi:hypothetical protein